MEQDQNQAVATRLTGPPVELILTKHLLKRAWWIAPLIVAVLGVVRGVDGAIAAAIGAVAVIANFYISGVLLAFAAKISLALYHAAALFGFFIRLGMLTVVILGLGQVMELDRVALAIAAVVCHLALVGFEAWAVAHGRERELDWAN